VRHFEEEKVMRAWIKLFERKNSIVVYRGEYTGNRGGPFWTPDREFARQFTQSGQDHEIKVRYVDPYDIYTDVKPYGGDPDAIDAAIAQAKADDIGFKAVWCSEGAGEPDSLFVYDRSILTMRP
jgi:hypothetical protein